MIIRGLDLANLGEQLAPANPGKVLLLDGDFLVYRAAATVKTLPTAIRRFYQMVLEEMFLLGTQECTVYLTPTGCAKCNRWHLPTVKPYQASRANRAELPLKQPLKQHLINNPEQYQEQGITVKASTFFEADDLIVMDSYALKERCIVSSGDKDLWLSPWPRLNASTGEVWDALDDPYGWIEWDATQAMPVRGHGLKFFWWQMLAGDEADNIKGIQTLRGKLCGKRGAYDAIAPLDSAEEAAELVVGAYAAIQQDVLAEAEALFLRRSEHDSAYAYFMDVLVNPAYRDWCSSLRDYHTQYLQYIQEQSLYGEET